MLHEFFRLSSEGIWCFQIEGTVTADLSADEQIAVFFEKAYLSECNDRMAQMYGFERAADLCGTPLRQLMVPEDPRNVEYLRAFIESGYQLRDAESAEVDREGRPKFFLNNLFGVVEEGRLVRAWGMQRDITEQKMEEQARQANEQLFRNLVDLLPQMLWISRADGAVEYWSEHGLAYFGMNMDRIGGWNWTAVIHPEDLDQAVQTWHRSLSTGERYEVEYRLLRHDGEYRWHIGRANCERDAAGEIVRWYGTCADVHERHVAQVALRRARDSAEEANRAKDQFLAVLSHELRTPLNPVLIAASELAKNVELPEEVREDARTIRQNVELEARIIDDLLDLTRITHGKLRMTFQALNIREALQDVLDICGGEAQRKGVAIILEAGEGDATIEGDNARIRQVLWNLLNNAIKFTPEGGRVLVQTSLEGDEFGRRIAIRVTDSGVGIEPAAVERIFHAFEQESANGRRFGGLGLGLAISRYIADAHGGTLKASSEGRGHGATFTFSLPLLEGHVRTPVASPSSFGTQSQERSWHILLVEDHADTRRLLARLLTREGHSVRAAATVAEAVALAAKETFDLLVSDIGLPDGTGYEVVQDMLKRRDVPSVALTGFGMEEDVRRAEEAGFRAHLTKPVDFEGLRSTIARLMQNRSTPPAAPFGMAAKR